MARERENVVSVLIGEDDQVTRKLLRAALAKQGYSIVAEAETGLQTAMLFEKHRPEITLLDINMPHGSGLTILRLILEIEPGARVIMLTGDTSPETVTVAKDLGAVDYVSKTSGPKRILEALNRAMGGRTLEQIEREADRVRGRWKTYR